VRAAGRSAPVQTSKYIALGESVKNLEKDHNWFTDEESPQGDAVTPICQQMTENRRRLKL